MLAMTRRPTRLRLTALALLITACGGPSERPRETASVLNAREADALLREQIQADFAAPVRRRWSIACATETGDDGRPRWRVQDTIWKVRLLPETLHGVELDDGSAYDIDATALAQNYSVIDFYVHAPPSPRR